MALVRFEFKFGETLCYLKSFFNHRTLNPISCIHPVSGTRETDSSFLVAVRFCSHKTQLMITAASGGVWRFPIRVLATEPEVDDVITIESVGLNKESVVGFRMNSQMRWVYGA